MKYIDLHVHSHFSDGTLSPTELVALADKQNLAAFALTDHDTVKGISEAQAAAQDLFKHSGRQIQIIPGVEMSAGFRNGDIHILGLNINPTDTVFQNVLNKVEAERNERNRKMAQNLKSAGIDISYEAIQALDPTAVITRAHFAKFLVQKGYVSSNDEAFKKYLNSQSPYYVSRQYLSPEDVICVIRKANGIPVLAHPLLYHLSETDLKQLIIRLKAAGLKALEAIYTCNVNNDEAFVRGLAHQNNLLISGGSDFHGSNKPKIQMGVGMGNLKVPYSVLEDLLTCSLSRC